jgi:hypothetical protein
MNLDLFHFSHRILPKTEKKNENRSVPEKKPW